MSDQMIVLAEDYNNKNREITRLQRELREAQEEAAVMRVAMKEARKLTLTELNTNFAKVATFSVAFETLMNEALESTTAGADLLRNYEHAQRVFKSLEQIVAPFDVADELSIDEKVGIVIDTLEDQSAELRAALIDIRDLDDDGALKTGEIAVEALESTTAGAELLRNYEHAQRVFKSLEQIVAPFDIADELSIDERVGMIIGTLKDQNAKLRTALEPFAKFADAIEAVGNANNSTIIKRVNGRWIRMGDLRAAREALKGANDGQPNR